MKLENIINRRIRNMKTDNTGNKEFCLSVKENIISILMGMLFDVILGELFYRSVIGVLFLGPIVYFYRRRKAGNLIKERKWRLNLEFKEGITALSAALEAGYSAENAFEEACRDLMKTGQENMLILKEFEYIVKQLRMNITVEKALSDFGVRTGIDDIKSFSDVFGTAKRTGGDLIHVIRITSRIISDKIEVKREIRTLVTAKRLEANIMKAIPLFILIYLSVSSPGFLNPLYHNILGVTVMTVFLFSYLGAFLMIDKITAIEM
jgi:tight adherence protein B